MSCLCHVNICATLEQQTICILERGRPNSLLMSFDDEGQRIAPMFRSACHFVIHRPLVVVAILVHLPPVVSYRRRLRLAEGLMRLIGVVVRERARHRRG